MAEPLPDPRPVERIRFSPRSVVAAVAMLGATLAVLRLFASATRVLGWIVAAAAVAGMLHPLVARLARRIPRALAVLTVVLGVVGGVGVVAYGVVDAVVTETNNLQESAPEAARTLERSARFGDLARDFELERRTKAFVDEVPNRLRGGTAADALRSAATRGVAFLATGVLTLFFVLHGPRLATGAIGQIGDTRRRARVERIARAAYARTVRYAGGTLMKCVAAGLLAYLVADLADVPGAAALGAWVALWDVVPIIGLAVGAVPIVLLAAVTSAERAIVVGMALVAYQVFEALVIQRRVERASLHLGPLLTLVAGFAGIELYGLGGGLVAVITVALALAAADETLPAENE